MIEESKTNLRSSVQFFSHIEYFDFKLENRIRFDLIIDVAELYTYRCKYTKLAQILIFFYRRDDQAFAGSTAYFASVSLPIIAGPIAEMQGKLEIFVIWCIWLYCALFSNGMELEALRHNFENLLPLRVTMSTKQPYRASYHFQTVKNWLNDPNGPMSYKGVYHLFFQYNPNGALFGDAMVWAHSISYDLVNWVRLSDALYPTEPFDINSCWSGSATILPGNKPVILYTGIDAKKNQVQNLATPKNLSDPFLVEWVKFDRNPIMSPPDGIKPDNFRDPTTAWVGQDGKWRVIIGSQINNEGMAVLYRSEDFVNWSKHRHPLYSSKNTGMWECPDFYPVSLNGTNGVDTSVVNPSVKHVIKAGFNSHDCYTLGTYVPEEDKFYPDTGFTGTSLDLRYDYGKFYASKTFYDSVKNRRILWAWVNESDSEQDDIEKGWSGLQSIPRSLWLDRNGRQLVQWPVEEIETLREKKVSFHGKKLKHGSLFELSGITASQADVEVTFELPKLEEAEFMDPGRSDPQLLCTKKDASISGRFGPFGLLTLASKNLTEQTAIFFRVFKSYGRYVVLMCSDQSRSSLRKEIDKTTYGAFVDIDPRYKMISLRSLIDHSIVESFGGDGRTCITARVYPQLAIDEEAHLYAFNNGTLSVVISNLNAWSMKKAQINMEGLRIDHQ